MSSSSPSPDERFASHLQSAQEAKQEGNAALQREQPRPASFQYKRACLYLLEYLPEANAEGEPIMALAGNSNATEEYAGVVRLLSGNKSNSSNSHENTSHTSRFHRLTEEQQSAVLELYIQLQNNLALTHYKLERYRDGMACATQALRAAAMLPTTSNGVHIGQARTKALLRRARCALALKEWSVAEEDLHTLRAEAASAECALDPAVPALETALHTARATEVSKEKALMKKMFAAA